MLKMTKDFLKKFKNGMNIPQSVIEVTPPPYKRAKNRNLAWFERILRSIDLNQSTAFLYPKNFQKKMNTGAFDQILFCVHSFLEEASAFVKKVRASGCFDQIHPLTLSVSEYTRAHILGNCCYLT